MRRFIRASILSFALTLAGGAHADEAWFRIGFGSGLSTDSAAPPSAGTNDSIEIAVSGSPEGRVYGDLSLPVAVSGVDGSYSIAVAGLPSGAVWTPDPNVHGSGTIAWQNATAGSYHLAVEVRDGSDVLVASRAIDLTVHPQLAASVPQSTYEVDVGGSLTISPAVQNLIAGPGTARWGAETALPTWLDLDDVTGEIEVDTSLDLTTTANVVLTAIDQTDMASASTEPFSVTVTHSCDVWTSRTSPIPLRWMEITYGNGIFVAVANDGANKVMTSPDGVTWTGRTAAILNANAVAYGNGMFVAVGNYGQIMSSSDGATWTSRIPPDTTMIADAVTYGNGLFVAAGYSSGGYFVMTSPDGIAWTARTAIFGTWSSIAYGNGTFVAVTSAGTPHLMTSTDGIAWTARTVPNNNWYSVVHGDGKFVAVASTGQVMTSVDGINWTAQTSLGTNGWNSVTYGNGMFVAVSILGTHQVATSPDGVSWTARTTPMNDWNSIAYGNGVFVAVPSSGADLMTSTCH
jgi:hypothetical protein